MRSLGRSIADGGDDAAHPSAQCTSSSHCHPIPLVSRFVHVGYGERGRERAFAALLVCFHHSFLIAVYHMAGVKASNGSDGQDEVVDGGLEGKDLPNGGIRMYQPSDLSMVQSLITGGKSGSGG